MAHPIIWPNKLFFYAIGNTPAACLTSDIPPEVPADILLLGCGDARNVLYTIYADPGIPSRKLDFTCCDVEPAVLARNVMLYTLIADIPVKDTSDYISKLWNLYFHFFIDGRTLSMILSQCQRLVEVSVDIQSWNDSDYGKFLRFSTTHTLSEVRRHWMLYFETQKLSSTEKKSLHAKFRKGNSADVSGPLYKHNLTSIRSAGPLWMSLKDLGSRQFDRYWKSGTTFGDDMDIAAAKQINPTFAYSAMGRGFALHYGSDPILSFHLAKGLAPLKGSVRTESASISNLIQTSKAQFKEWCLALNRRLIERPSSLTIRSFIGDALAFCRALHYRSVNNSINSGVYTMSWSPTLILLDGGGYEEDSPHPAPLQFDVIDTSNLTDHLGLLNILVTSRPLMRRKPSSILHTNTLLPANDKGMVRDGFLTYLCGDISTMSLLLDLIPMSYVSNFTTHSNVHELTSLVMQNSSRQFHERVAWRIGSISDTSILPIEARTDKRLQFDDQQLADVLYDIYLQMFNDENMNVALQSMIKHPQVHYIRFSYAYLLRFVKDTVAVDWSACMKKLHTLISKDKTLIVGLNNLQDLYISMHLVGVYSFFAFSTEFNNYVVAKEGILNGWDEVPPLLCVTFIIPRSKFMPIENLDPKEFGSLAFMGAIVGNGSHSCFQHYQSFFGQARADYPDIECSQEPTITFEKDPQGYNGTSPVIFTFYIPTYQIGHKAENLQIALSVRPTGMLIHKLTPILGQFLTIHSAPLMDRQYVHITRERPGNEGELQKLLRASFHDLVASDESTLTTSVKVALDQRRVAQLTGRIDIVDNEAKVAFEKKASVEIQQVSPQAMRVSFDKYRRIIPYPFPIDSTESKSRIARKSGYLEIDVKLAGPIGRSGMRLKPLPVVKHHGILSLWNVHYLNLDVLPALELSQRKWLSFIKTHISMTSSDRENRLTKAEAEGSIPDSELDVITRVKQSIGHLFMKTCGLDEETGGSQFRAFGLSDPDNGGVYTLIFVNGARLDLASHTVVLDACVLPMTQSLVKMSSGSIMNAIEKVNEKGLVQIHTKPDEVRAWKHLLPAYTERCRTWTHDPIKCEYLVKGGVIPVSVKMDGTPLCSCGRGKNLTGTPFDANWKERDPVSKDWKSSFAEHVTRAAISPLFAVPFVDTIAGDLYAAFYKENVKNGRAGSDMCVMCDGPGKPKLLVCSACKKVSYCSPECQRVHWKVHKRVCKRHSEEVADV
ncbi:hypothetical protein JOM56_009001 [Amanita muscaria]